MCWILVIWKIKSISAAGTQRNHEDTFPQQYFFLAWERLTTDLHPGTPQHKCFDSVQGKAGAWECSIPLRSRAVAGGMRGATRRRAAIKPATDTEHGIRSAGWARVTRKKTTSIHHRATKRQFQHPPGWGVTCADGHSLSQRCCERCSRCLVHGSASLHLSQRSSAFQGGLPPCRGWFWLGIFRKNTVGVRWRRGSFRNLFFA